MKIFKDIQVGDEIEFINSDSKIERATVCYVDDKKFSVSVLRKKRNGNNAWYTSKLSWYLSGKKTNRHYTYGNALRATGF